MKRKVVSVLVVLAAFIIPFTSAYAAYQLYTYYEDWDSNMSGSSRLLRTGGRNYDGDPVRISIWNSHHSWSRYASRVDDSDIYTWKYRTLPAGTRRFYLWVPDRPKGNSKAGVRMFVTEYHQGSSCGGGWSSHRWSWPINQQNYSGVFVYYGFADCPQLHTAPPKVEMLECDANIFCCWCGNWAVYDDLLGAK